MKPLSKNKAAETPSQINDKVDNVGDQRKQLNAAPKVSSREAESQPLLSQPPSRTEKPSATALKVTYFLIRAADRLDMSWAVKQLLQLDLGDVVSAVKFGADDNVLNTFSAANQNLTTAERAQLKTAMANVSFERAIFLTQFLHPELNKIVAEENEIKIKKFLAQFDNEMDRPFLAGAFLMRAMAQNKMTSAVALIEGGAAIDNSVFRQSNALIFSAQCGCSEVTETLIAVAKCREGNIPSDYLNARNSRGYTALFVAGFCRDTAVFKALLEGGADPEIPCMGTTVFQYALDGCAMSIYSAYIDYKKPATVAGAMAIVNDAILLFSRSDQFPISPRETLEFIVRKVCHDCLPPHEINDFARSIIARLLKDRSLTAIANFLLPVHALFDAITPLSETDMVEIKNAFLPDDNPPRSYSRDIDRFKQLVQDCRPSKWAVAFGHLQTGSFDELDETLSTKSTAVVGHKKTGAEVGTDYNNLFRSLAQIRGASTSLELREVYTPLPGHLIGKLINVPIRAKGLAQALLKELKSDRSHALRLLDANGKKFDIEAKVELSRLEVQLFAFEVENILTEIENNVPEKPQLNKTSLNGEDYEKAVADYERRLVAIEQASNLLNGLQPASTLAAQFQLRLVDNTLTDRLVQAVNSGQTTVVEALKELGTAEENAGFFAWVESDISEPLRNWAISQLRLPSERIRKAGNTASHT